MIPLDPSPNLIDQVYARILEAITDRTLLPGQRIRQNELAERLGVSRQTVNAIETGRYDPSLPLAFKIAALFGLKIEQIFVPNGHFGK